MLIDMMTAEDIHRSKTQIIVCDDESVMIATDSGRPIIKIEDRNALQVAEKIIADVRKAYGQI